MIRMILSLTLVFTSLVACLLNNGIVSWLLLPLFIVSYLYARYSIVRHLYKDEWLLKIVKKNFFDLFN